VALGACSPESDADDEAPVAYATCQADPWPGAVRVPAEWEPQAAVWLQWPGDEESSARRVFVRIISVIQAFEPVVVLVADSHARAEAKAYLAQGGVPETNVTWQLVPTNSSWLRDNGPVYVLRGDEVVVQDWGFDAWGGNFGAAIPYAEDNLVPRAITGLLGLGCEDRASYVLERGNLEVNGVDTAILGWDCQHDRNPTWSRVASEELLQEALGVSRVLWVEGHDPEDLTTGHIDGIVRFVDEDTVAVAQWLVDDPSAQTTEDAARLIAAAGFEVVRFPVPGYVSYGGQELPAMYMNWLVGNGFVLGMAFGEADWDAAARRKLEELYPEREVVLIDAMDLWLNGGGVHCVTNDQPAAP